jgi:KDO2-lipid IV(A) lauroyltransferase
VNKSVFTATLLHPRYWLTWLLLLLLAAIAQLPYRWQVFLGKRLGHLMLRFAKKRRTIAACNLCLCFPGMSINARKKLLKKNFEIYGLAVFETGIAWFMPRSRLQKLFVIKGQQQWEKLRGQGVLVIGMHFPTLEICNAAVNQHFNLHLMYKPHKNPVYNYVQGVRRARHNPNSTVISRDDIRTTVKTLKSGEWVWYAPDQDYGRRHSEFIPWFGIPVATVAATPRLAAMSKASVVAISHRHNADFSGYEIELHPLFDNFPSGDSSADLLRINQFIEDCVRRHPEEYLWVHRRFKTRPDGEASLY